ncbi:MAG: hypothetical protein Faunusvirus16_4 [Faunusvirus sp.]|uniref:Uncharacterized protein n=1 Tax=Faunusvirus sp. TaxID=2487766 RepID=A0A3G4ZX92_9VIRU|nr:MAG: hypothetical protein Faunusvirus16_4 [Faunusvirus sp.]
MPQQISSSIVAYGIALDVDYSQYNTLTANPITYTHLMITIYELQIIYCYVMCSAVE